MMRPKTGNGDGTVHALQPIPSPGNDYNHPYYFSDSDDPLYTISCIRNCMLAGQNVSGKQVRIPCHAVPADGTDHHLTVIDQVTGLEWGFWNVQTNLSSCAGGTLRVGLAGNTPMNGDGRNTCANAVCVGLTAGIVRAQELAAGHIDHALFMVSHSCNRTTVYPGWGPNSCRGKKQKHKRKHHKRKHHKRNRKHKRKRATAPAVGQWFQLNLTPSQIQSLPNVAGWQKTILTAISVYGMFVGDQGSNGAFELQTESPATYSSMRVPNPWRDWAANGATQPNSHITYGGGTLSLDLGGGLPTSFWKKNLRVIHPCVIQRTC
jgi:hypothetical protein